MQTRNFFRKYSHGDLAAKVLSLETFVLYGMQILYMHGISKRSSITHGMYTYFFLFAENQIDGSTLLYLITDFEEFQNLIPHNGDRLKIKSIITKVCQLRNVNFQ